MRKTTHPKTYKTFPKLSIYCVSFCLKSPFAWFYVYQSFIKKVADFIIIWIKMQNEWRFLCQIFVSKLWHCYLQKDYSSFLDSPCKVRQWLSVKLIVLILVKLVI